MSPLGLAALFLVSSQFYSGVEAIWCFQCNSMFDPDCTYLQVNETRSTHYKECSGDYGDKEPFCRKISQRIHDRDGLVRVVRGCGWLSHPTKECYSVSNMGHSEKVCQCFTNACNSGSGLVTSFFLISCFAFIVGT